MKAPPAAPRLFDHSQSSIFVTINQRTRKHLVLQIIRYLVTAPFRSQRTLYTCIFSSQHRRACMSRHKPQISDTWSSFPKQYKESDVTIHGKTALVQLFPITSRKAATPPPRISRTRYLMPQLMMYLVHDFMYTHKSRTRII